MGPTQKCGAHGGGHRCAVCKLINVGKPGKLCYTCRTGTLAYKQQEAELIDKLMEWDLHWSSQDSPIPCAPQGCLKRPDFVFYTPEWVVVLECDEHYHRNYEIDCEISRIGVLKDNLKLPMMLVRFNPHAGDYDSLERLMCTDLAHSAQELTLNEFGIHVVYIGYPEKRVNQLNDRVEDLCGLPFPSTVL